MESVLGTLLAVSLGLGAWRVDFEFKNDEPFRPIIDTTSLEKSLPDPTGRIGQ